MIEETNLDADNHLRDPAGNQRPPSCWCSRLFCQALAALLCISPVGLSQSKSVLLQPEIQYQRLDGFGITIGSGSAKEIMALPASERIRILDLVFGPDGARVNIVRAEVTWAGQRLAMTHPLYLRGFMYYFAENEDETAQFNLFREAQKRGEILWSSCVWTPPPQWKSNQSLPGGSLLPKHYEDFATYLAAYVEFYKKLRFHDISVLSLQNAPSVSGPNQSCIFEAEPFKELLKIVGKKFIGRGILSRIMLPDAAGWDELDAYAQPILADAEAKGMVSYLSVHSAATDGAGRAKAKELSKRHSLRLWQTEYAVPSDDRYVGLAGGLELAMQMLTDLAQAESHAWIYWTLFPPANSSGRLGLLDRSGSSIQGTKRFWAFAQFSRHLARNSVRIASRGGTVPLVAFRNPEYNAIMVVLVNASRQSMTETLELKGWNLERRRAYRTSEKEDGVSVPLPPESGPTISLNLEPSSITTLVAQIRRIS